MIMNNEILTATGANIVTAKPFMSFPLSMRSIYKLLLSLTPLRNFANLLSQLVGERINVIQTICLMHTAIALMFAVFPVNISLPLRFLFIAWFAISVLQCKRVGLGEE